MAILYIYFNFYTFCFILPTFSYFSCYEIQIINSFTIYYLIQIHRYPYSILLQYSIQKNLINCKYFKTRKKTRRRNRYNIFQKNGFLVRFYHIPIPTHSSTKCFNTSILYTTYTQFYNSSINIGSISFLSSSDMHQSHHLLGFHATGINSLLKPFLSSLSFSNLICLTKKSALIRLKIKTICLTKKLF